MKDRCLYSHHPKYYLYGGRGITVCEEWLDSETFLTYCDEVLGPRPHNHTLDRIDRDKGYEPGNVRWASYKEQNDNRIDYTPAQMRGRIANHKIGKSGYKWVSPYRDGYKGQFSYNYTNYNTRKFDTPEEAYEEVLRMRDKMGLPLE